MGADAVGWDIGKAEAARKLQMRPQKQALIRYYIAGLGRTLVAAGAAGAPGTGALTRPFKGERLVTTNDVAGAFQILGIEAGPEQLVISQVGIPARVLVETAQDVCLDFPTVSAALGVNLDVQNISGAGQNFEGAVLGYVGIATA